MQRFPKNNPELADRHPAALSHFIAYTAIFFLTITNRLQSFILNHHLLPEFASPGYLVLDSVVTANSDLR